MSVTTWDVSRAKDINKLAERIGLHHADPRLSTKLKDDTAIGAVHKSNKGRPSANGGTRYVTASSRTRIPPSPPRDPWEPRPSMRHGEPPPP